MDDKFILLEKTLKAECADGPVYYYPNRGNWGDALIRYGTLKFFRDINLDYRELTGTIKPTNWRQWFIPYLRGGTVIYGGGGAWRKLYGQSSQRVAALRRRFKVIVLPSTYEVGFSIPGTVFFCRDRYESQQNMRDALFCHDMAFYIGNEFQQNRKGSGTGYFFRSDKESSGRITIPPDNNDMSSERDHLADVAPFFGEINRHAVICTDRLHIAIAACLLGKEVHLYPGTYFKNRAVYLSSMKDYFANVHFHEDFDL